jgi:uncharacterized protein YndB with AHSA1/START domain
MTRSTLDAQSDLVLERIVDVPKELVWKAWTVPEHLMKWFCPVPWQAVECEIDLRPGGIFRTRMRGPEGQEMAHLACYLEVVPAERLVWTNALTPGYRPSNAKSPIPFFTATIALEPSGPGTKYTATVIHANEEDARKHDAMGFREGWGTALDQLVAVAKRM